MADYSQSSLLFLNLLFPGTKTIPGFIKLKDAKFLAASICHIDAITMAFIAKRHKSQEQDINKLLKSLKEDDNQKVTEFLNSAVEVYFSAPAVVSGATGSPVPLFPNERVLPDFDYGLLKSSCRQIKLSSKS